MPAQPEPEVAPGNTTDMGQGRDDPYHTQWESVTAGWSAKEAQERLKAWQTSIRVSTWAHGQLRSKFSKYEWRLSMVLVTINAIISSSIFTSIVDSPVAVYLQVVAGVMSMVAAVLTAWKTENAWAEKAEAHRNAERGFEKISHLFIYKLELMGKCPVDKKGELIKEWKEAITQWEDLEAVSPSISPAEYAKFKKEKAKQEKFSPKVSPKGHDKGKVHTESEAAALPSPQPSRSTTE